MNALRNLIDSAYIKGRPLLFKQTPDPEDAHKHFVKIARLIHHLGLENILLDCPENRMNPGFEISNGAGFNKNGDIPPSFLKALGFDRVVVGTVTADPWKGNPKIRIKRYTETESMVNWMGLPGVGAKQVADNLYQFGDHKVPITINLMSTPEKTGHAVLQDIRDTINITKFISYVDRYELNISCPNTGNEARKEHQEQLEYMLKVVMYSKNTSQEVYIKVSPDLKTEDMERIIETSHRYGVTGFTTTNTTTYHDPKYITEKPNPEGKGGASGEAVYDHSWRTQIAFKKLIDKKGYKFKLIGVGGIDSYQKAEIRKVRLGTSGIQIFTPLIFKGPALLRQLRNIK